MISMAVTAPPGTQNKLIDAAAEAGVKYVFPNEFNYDFVGEAGEKFAQETIVGTPVVEARKRIEAAGKSSWIGLSCGFWYTFSIAGGSRCFGIDTNNKVFDRIDNGDVKLTTSTFEQVARAAGALLSLKAEPKGEDDTGPFLSDWKNKACRIQSFHVSQNDMFESVKRVTGASDADWTIRQCDSKERWEDGVKRFQNGEYLGLAHALYTRCFFPDGMSTLTDLSNEVLGLPKENLDDLTREALGISISPETYRSSAPSMPDAFIGRR